MLKGFLRRKLPTHTQEYDEEGGRKYAAIVRATKCPPTRALFSWLLGVVSLIGVLAAMRVLERRRQISTRIADAQAAGALLPAGGERLVPADCLPILIPLANRPEYFSQVVRALNGAAGLENAVVVFSQDGHDADIYDLAMNQLVQPQKKIHLWHRRPWLGIPSLKDNEYATTDNVYSLLSFAFDELKVRLRVDIV